MHDNNTYYRTFNNYGYIETTFSESQLEPIKNEIDEYKKSNTEYEVGTITEEYRLEKSLKYIENLLLPYCKQYDEIFEYTSETINQEMPLYLDNVWVNFQRKHEFNPSHTHSGVFSFVLWIDIPYNIEDEIAHESSRFMKVLSDRLVVPGHFQISYTSSIGSILQYYIPADKTYNSKLILFPSSMVHTVFPFYTSDKPRISVAGNFKLNKLEFAGLPNRF